MAVSRSTVVSSFTIIKGSFIDETFAVFRDWDFELSRFENLRRVREDNSIGASSANWARDVAKVLNRRFQPGERDRVLVELAKADCSRDIWQPLMLFHMTRDEYLVRDFLLHWLYPHYTEGTYRLHTDEVITYLKELASKEDIEVSSEWSESTTARVASGLLRIASDFGLLTRAHGKEFASYHLPEESFLYLIHAMAETEPNARKLVESEEWRMFLMDAEDVERELLRLHQFRKVEYQRAGSIVELKLPYDSPADYAKELCA